MSNIHIPIKEKLKSIPEMLGIRLHEEPRYETVEKDGDFEIRVYQKQLRASVTIENMPFDEFREKAFDILTEYIYGENSKIIDMTSPVLQSQTSDNSWTMSVILPEKISLGDVPKPLNPDIQISEVKAADVAVYSYHGTNSLAKIEAHKKELLDWLDKHPKYEAAAEASAAQYDAPFVISFMKKNEIHVPIRSIAFV